MREWLSQPGRPTPRRAQKLFRRIHNVSEIMRVSRQFFQRGRVFAGASRHDQRASRFETTTAELFGIDPASHLRTTDLAKQIVDGSFDDFRNNTTSVIVGYRLADLLEVRPGDTVQLLSPGGEYFRFNVAAIARSGVGTIDSSRVYAHARVAQRLLKNRTKHP